MAAVEQPELVTITVNDVELQVPKGELIVESVKRLGLEIPIFCYHPRMKPVGMCRMCLVDVGFKQPDGSVRKMPKPQAGCTLPADNNMVIYTDTEQVQKDRKSVLEFLLINHPLDCPICDRGGECPLQNNTLVYGPSTSRYTEIKRHAVKAFPLSNYVTLDLERCIQCGRCVRFTEEISGDAQLAFRFRGAEMQPSTYQMTDFESKFSGNVIEICPVGALTSAKYRFRARPWDLETQAGICTICSNGCNVWFDHRANKFVRVNGRTNEAINEEWTCDRGKFGHDFYNSEKRLKTPLMRKGTQLVPVSWGEAYDAILEAFGNKAQPVAALVGGTVSNEGLYLLQKLFRDAFGSNNLDHRWTKYVPSGPHRAKVKSTIADFESKSNILVFGGSLAADLPILFLRIRKAWFKSGARIVVASDSPNEVDEFATVSLRYRPGTEFALASALHAVSQGASDEDVAIWTKETGVSVGQLRGAASVLGSDGATVTTRRIFNSELADQALQKLADLSAARGLEFNCYALGANDEGAEILGVVPEHGVGSASVSGEPGMATSAILDAASRSKLGALWLIEADPLALHEDKSLALRALENVEFLVVQGIAESEAMMYASVVLPHAAPAEMDGTYTNMEGRVQRMKQVITAPGDAKQAWRIFGELLLRAKPIRPYFNAAEIAAEIAEAVPGCRVTGVAPGDSLDLPGHQTTNSAVSESN